MDGDLELGMKLFDSGDTDAALACFQRAADLVPQGQWTVPGAVLLCTAAASVGLASVVRKYAAFALQHTPDNRDAAYQLGLALMDDCEFERAADVFGAILAREPQDTAWYKLQLARVYATHGAVPGFSPDQHFTREFKIGEADSRPASLYIKCCSAMLPRAPEGPLPAPRALDAETLRRAADEIGKLFVLETPGFALNRRLLRAMGLAVIEASSAPRAWNDWRGFMDIFVRWRRNANSRDSVWWIEVDQPTYLRTPLYNNGHVVARYAPYMLRALQMIKQRIVDSPEMSQFHAGVGAIADLTHRSLWDALGQDVSVSTVVGSEKLSGTAFIVARESMHCSTPMEPDRHGLFSERLAAAFKESPSLFLYYWLNAQALSRGSAICGFAAFVAMIHIRSLPGRLPRKIFPPGVQWDLESFLCESERAFAARVESFVAGAGFVPCELPPMASGLSTAEMRRLL